MVGERIWSWVNCTLLLGFALLSLLKLTGAIDWNWWFVSSPLLLMMVIFIVAITIIGFFFPHLMESKAVQQSQVDEAFRPRSNTAPASTLWRWLDAIQGVIIGTVIFGGCAGLVGWSLYRHYGEQFSTFWGGAFAVITLSYGLVRATLAIAAGRRGQPPIQIDLPASDKCAELQADEPSDVGTFGPQESPRQ